LERDTREKEAAEGTSAGARFERAVSAEFRLERGIPLPLGVIAVKGGFNFAIFSKHATSVTLVLFLPDEPDLGIEFPLDERVNRTGDVWHGHIDGLDPSIRYAWRMDRIGNDRPEIYRYYPKRILLDPYARALTGSHDGHTRDEGASTRHRCLIPKNSFDWGVDQPLQIPLRDSIIYEAHVRGFTQNPNSGVRARGTFAGLVERIPYLKSLGITAVELLPVCEFDETSVKWVNPRTGQRLRNFWGYDPISFFAIHAAYSSARGDDEHVGEFKTMVKTFHEAGLEVILDVVYNHSGEGDQDGPVYSYRGIDNSVYYMLDRNTGEYMNYSGCGNTLNCNHPVVRDLIIEALRYWVIEMHVDGFRFDLASILGRGPDGSVLANPPLIESLSKDPILAESKLIAEAWDAAGLYQVGSFPAGGRWAEWNGKFRDDVRKFVKSDPGMVSALATRLAGSSDLYHASKREPWHSINFVTCHDGFPLADLVSYDRKHNEENGEDNRDGVNNTMSWNCGVEGPTDSPEVNRLRGRQIRNFAALLFLAQGVPMLLAGDEMGRTQGGNNNAYCQDNEIAWVDWDLRDRNAGLLRYFRNLIRFRTDHTILRRGSFTPENDPTASRIEWGGFEVGRPDWSWESRSLAMHVHGSPDGDDEEHVYVIAHAHWEKADFALPRLAGYRWFRVIDTSLESPRDIVDPGEETALADQRKYTAGPRSTVVLLGKPLRTVLRIWPPGA
jgi:isoamylase